MKKIINLNQLSSEEWEREYTSYVDLHPKEDEKLFALKKIVYFLEQNSSDYFISVGTCLGIYRDNKLIEWDDDIDIDIIGSSYEKIIKKLIKFATKNKYPFKQGNNLFHPKINIFINRVKVSIGKLSIGRFSRQKLFRPKTKIPLKLVQPTKSFQFNNIKLRIPNKTEKYLAHVYGDSWQTPIRWVDEDQYKKDYERKGKIYTLLDTTQILISKMFL